MEIFYQISIFVGRLLSERHAAEVRIRCSYSSNIWSDLHCNSLEAEQRVAKYTQLQLRSIDYPVVYRIEPAFQQNLRMNTAGSRPLF